MQTLILPPLSPAEIAATLSHAKATVWLSSLDHDPYEIWRNVETMDEKAKDAGCTGYYSYSRRRITVNTCSWGDRLVLVFNAPYVGTLSVLGLFLENHSVYYYVKEDGSLEWANEDGAEATTIG
jgi:hypothetical protein